MAEHEIAPRDGGVIEPAHQSVFGGLVKIDQHIPAEDHVELQPEFDGVHQVEGLEDHVVFDLRSHGVLAGPLDGDEVALAPVRGDGVRPPGDAPLGGCPLYTTVAVAHPPSGDFGGRRFS